jgi:hypothetical protein
MEALAGSHDPDLRQMSEVQPRHPSNAVQLDTLVEVTQIVDVSRADRSAFSARGKNAIAEAANLSLARKTEATDLRASGLQDFRLRASGRHRGWTGSSEPRAGPGRSGRFAQRRSHS